MADESITVAQLHEELNRRFGEIDEQRRWSLRSILTPHNVLSIVVSLALLLVGGTTMWRDVKHEVAKVADTQARETEVRKAADLRLDRRIDDEKTERQAADERIEKASSDALEEIRDTLRDLNKDIKQILTALPRESK